MEGDNPVTSPEQSKGKGRGRRSKASTESISLQSTLKTVNANTPAEERKTYSKRERKPTKRFDIEGQSEAEEDRGSVSTPKRTSTSTPKSGKKRGRTPNDKIGVKTPNKITENEDDTVELEGKTQIIKPENDNDKSDGDNSGNADESVLKDSVNEIKPVSARKKRGPQKKAKAKTPKRNTTKGGKKEDGIGDVDEEESEPDDEVDEKDVDVKELLSKDNDKETKPASAKKAGRPPKIREAGNETPKPASSSTGKRRGRAPKSLQDNTPKGGNSPKGGKNVGEDEEEEAIGSRSNRKRKKINYSTLDSASEDESEGSPVPTPGKRKKKDVDGDFKGNSGGKGPKSAKKSEKSSADKVPLNCPKCEKVLDTKSALQRHAAVEHQIWWTPENPAGDGETREALRNIMKYKKHLNCTKCDKQINFAHYYYHHLEWCGREDERYKCELCGNPNLKAIWQSQHRLNCPSLVRKTKEAEGVEKNVQESSEDKNGSVPGKKRKAAQKARSMVLNLSKNQDEDDYDKKDDKDPDARIDDDEEDGDDDDDDGDDEDEDVEDDLENLIDDGPSVHRAPYRTAHSGWGVNGKYLDSYPLMLNYSKVHFSKTVHADLLPIKTQWVKLDSKEYGTYLPKADESIRFTTNVKKAPVSLKLYESSTEHGFPIIYTGLCVWKLAWCPMPLHCSDDQFLAVVGKMDHTEKFPIIHHNGRGIIQIWNVGSLSARAYTVNEVPGLWYTIIHDYGQATEIKWCPSGCHKSNEDDSEHYSRLGLLAVSFTDGSIRIFSLPYLPAPDEGEIRVYRPAPVMCLLPHRQPEKIDIACSCMDWHVTRSHRKILAGYSDGSVRLFNLESQDPPLCFKTGSTSGRCLLPFQSFFAHGKLVRSVRWLCNSEDVVATACENFETYFWNLSNTEFPLFQDQLFYMMTTLASSLWHQGLFTGSDDNYALNTNRGRYIEMSNIAYNCYTHVRKDEVVCLNFSAQSGCIWEVSFSNWLSYALACDNRGNIHGMAMADTVKYAIDTKIYKFRQLLLTIDLKHENGKQLTMEGKEDANNCNCDKSTCIKCNKNRNSGSEQNSVVNQLPDILQTNGHKDSSNESSSSNNQSADTLSNIDKSGNCISKEPDKSSQSNEVPLTRQDESSVKKTTDTENSYLVFHDHFESFKSGWPDTPADTYRRVTPAALKTVSFNPNHLQCTWIAYAGDAGLLRLSNIYKLLPKTASKHIQNE